MKAWFGCVYQLKEYGGVWPKGGGKHVNSDRKRVRLFMLMRILSTSKPPTPDSYFVAVREPLLPLAFLQVMGP